VQDELRERGLVEGEGEAARLTPAGTAMADQLLSARREELRALLDSHEAERAPEVQQLIERLCVELSGQRPDRAQASSS
jgi:Mn-dependent DtxR family transcriptional regulator